MGRSAAAHALMVEVTLNNAEVADLLRALGYVLVSPEGALIDSDQPSGNVFALHQDAHARGCPGSSAESSSWVRPWAASDSVDRSASVPRLLGQRDLVKRRDSRSPGGFTGLAVDIVPPVGHEEDEPTK